MSSLVRQAPRCWVAETLPDAGPCDGVLQRAHLVRQQVLRREVGVDWRKAAADPRSWVPMCFKHHGQLDYSRTLKIPRELLPPELEEFAAEHDVLWWIDREYGPLIVDGLVWLRPGPDAPLRALQGGERPDWLDDELWPR